MNIISKEDKIAPHTLLSHSGQEIDDILVRGEVLAVEIHLGFHQ